MTTTTEFQLTASEWATLSESATSISIQQLSYGTSLIFIGDTEPDDDVGVHISERGPIASFIGISGKVFAKSLENNTKIIVIKS
jgi:hypothetical protein